MKPFSHSAVITLFALGVGIAGVALAPCAAAAQAAKSQTAGFYLGLHLNGTGIRVEDGDDTENGGGIGLGLGYGFSPKWTVFFNGDFANINGANGPDYDLTHGDIGVRYTFANTARQWIPFVEVAATGLVAAYDAFADGDDVELRGGSLTLGGGVSYYLNRAWALEVALHWSVGEFTESKIGDDTFGLDDQSFGATSSRFNIGASWHPRKK